MNFTTSKLALLTKALLLTGSLWGGMKVHAEPSSPAAKVYGKIQVVDTFPDYKVRIVTSFPDLKVQVVNAFANAPGKWQFVDRFPDFKVQFVKSGEDFTIQYVKAFPGPRK